MKVLVCGGRDYADAAHVEAMLTMLHDSDGPITLLIHGAARGADSLAAAWADKAAVPTLPFPADWAAHGRAAGPRRNEKMLRMGKPDVVVAFPGGRGTAHMVRIAREAGVDVLEINRSPDRCVQPEKP